MWTDFDEPSYTILAETAAARERARPKKRRKRSPRSKRKSNGAPHAASNKLTLRKPTFSTTSVQPAASVAQTDSVALDLEAFRDEQPEAPKVSILQGAPTLGALGSTAAQVHPSRIEQCDTLGVDDLAILPADAAPKSPVENGGQTTATQAPSAIASIGQQASKGLSPHGARRRVSSAVVGSIILCCALWLLSPISYPEAEPVITTEQDPVSVRVWTDPAPFERVQTAAEVTSIVVQPKQAVIVAPTGLTAVPKAPAEAATHTDYPADDQLVASNPGELVSVPQEVAQSVSVGSVPLPPRRPVSLLVRHMPEAHPVPSAAMKSAPASTEPPAEQTEPSESYASFSARKHEIGTHKLSWGMARLHEDPNSDSGRGAVWDFVPTEP